MSWHGCNSRQRLGWHGRPARVTVGRDARPTRPTHATIGGMKTPVKAITMTTRLIWIATAVALLLLPAQGRAQQQSPGGRREQEPNRERGERQKPDRPDRAEREEARRQDKAAGSWSRNLLEPSPDDRGPLLPGEEQELRKFVDDELPVFARLLRRVEQDNPSAFRRHLPRLVPRLRHLRRIHTESPELARTVAGHAANLLRLKMLQLRWRQADPDQRRPLERQMRHCLTENVRLEAAAIEQWANELETNRDERVADELASLTKEGADLASEPPDVRSRVDELAFATTDAKRTELEGQLTKTLERRLDWKIRAMRKRAARLRDGAPEEVDRRLEQMLGDSRQYAPPPSRSEPGP